MTNKTSIFLRAATLCIVHCALCISSAYAVSITATATAVKAGDPTPVQAEISGGSVSHLYLVYQIDGSTYAWNTNEMTSVSATTYTGFIPPLTGAVTVKWYVTDGTANSGNYSTTLDALPDYNRYHDGKVGANKVWVIGQGVVVSYNTPAAQKDMDYGWKYDSDASTNLTAQAPNGSQWKASGVCIGTSKSYIGGRGIDTAIGMDYPSLYFLNLPPGELPYIRSPKLEGGVGTIDFRTTLISNNDLMKESELSLQVAYTDAEPGEGDWIEIKKYGFGAYNGGVFSRPCHEVLDDYGVTYVRIVRSGYYSQNPDITVGRLAVDNICITKPAANVGIIEKLKNPGYPAADQDILMRCAVTNCVEETPAVNRRVSVKYQYVARDTYSPKEDAWLSADMAYMGKDQTTGLDWYEGVIPTQKVGYVWYYYQVDYDGYAWSGTLKEGNNIVNADESVSPAYWDAGEDTHVPPTAGTKFQVRPYRSRYARISLDAFPTEASIPEMTLVDNEQWQTIVPVSGLTVISNYFIGYGYYADDAEAYESVPVIWGENNPDALSDPTLAGFLESTHDGTVVTNRLVALNEKNYTGFYLYRFSSNDLDEEAANNPEGDRRYDYVVKKAVYQDFDEWTASPFYYESSLGGLPTLTFTEDFDGNEKSAQGGAICVTNAWVPNSYAIGDTMSENFQDDSISDVFSTDDVKTHNRFLRRGSRILLDRKKKNTDTRVNKTMALSSNGQIQNTKDSLPHGLEKISFKARASIDDNRFAIYSDGTAWAFNQTVNNQAIGNEIFVSAKWALTDMAPSRPYFSYIFLYQSATEDDGASWYEVRLVQTDSADANNNTVSVQLWRRDPTASASIPLVTNVTVKGYGLGVDRTVIVRAYNDSNKFSAQVSLTGNTTYQAKVTDGTPPAGRLAKGGTIGFGVFDAAANITVVKVGTTSGGNNLLSGLGSTWEHWSHGGRRPDGQFRWDIQSSYIKRAVPEQKIGIYAADRTSDGEPWADPDRVYPVGEPITVNSFQMADFTVDFKAWNQKFVQIRYVDGDGGIVLDDINYYPWRAASGSETGDEARIGNQETGTSYHDWTSTDQQDQWLDTILNPETEESMRQHWAVFEGWVTNSGAFKLGATFERTRANTNLVQGIVSPVLENGMGSCSFSYSVSGGKVVYAIERSDEGDEHKWAPVAVYMNNAGESGERYAKVGVYFGGRLRVRVYGPQDVAGLAADFPDCGYDPAWGYTASSAKLLVDNLRVKDYPKDENDNAWNAYNLLITGDAPDGQVYNNSGKSCFFNNSPTDGTYGVEEFTEDDPYLESPPLSGVGVGEIAFQYIIVTNTASANTDGHIVIKVAPDRDTPLSQWKTITNLVVSANGTAFVKFDNEKIFDENNYVVRFYNSKAPGTPRVVIDNVLVTAPARPSFEFEYVKLQPVQPLAGTNTVVEAKIMREIMNPKGIRIYISYHLFDTNNVSDNWGVTNWFNARTSPKIELVSDKNVEKVYRTPEGGGIPAFSANDLVEFVVWGVHDGIDLAAGDTPIIQGRETFEVPAWYRTVDFEELDFVSMDINVTTNRLWNNAYNRTGAWSPYFWVFSCPPETFFVNEINNWRSDSVTWDYGSAEYIEFAGYAGTDLSGWKLAVIYNGDLDDMEYVIPAGTRLRANGPTGWGFFVWGDSCASDSFTVAEGDSRYEWENTPFSVDAAFPDSADREVRHLGTYAGIVIYRPNGMVEELVRFGTRNADPFMGAEEIWDYAGMKPNRSPNSLSRISKDDEVSGDAVEGRVASDFTWSTEKQSPVDVNGVSQVFADLGADTPVALYYPDGTEITSADVLAWIERYGAEQSDIDHLGTKAKVDEEFLLNLDLTKSCVAELKITSIQIVDGTVYLGVQLTRTEDGTSVGTRKINGTLKLLGRADLTTGTFTALQPDAFDSTFTTGNAVNIEYELPGSNPPRFFKVIVE